MDTFDNDIFEETFSLKMVLEILNFQIDALAPAPFFTVFNGLHGSASLYLPHMPVNFLASAFVFSNKPYLLSLRVIYIT
jgi:hypothetical protein